MQSKITLTGLYNYDNTLFDKLNFPAGIDRDLAINRILNKSEEFELVYSEFYYLQDRIGIWGDMWARTFEKWVKALSIDYDPLYNYDRHEEYSDTRGREYNDSKSDSRADIQKDESVTSSSSSSSSNTITGSTTDSTTEQSVSAYDEAGYSDKQKEDANANTRQTGAGNSEANSDSSLTSNTNTVSQGNEDTKGTSKETLKHDAHLYGNIGVTTSQQMLNDELNIATWNLYEHISDIFIDEFCILVY